MGSVNQGRMAAFVLVNIFFSSWKKKVVCTERRTIKAVWTAAWHDLQADGWLFFKGAGHK